MLTNDYTQQWVMNPDNTGHITNTEIYEILISLKEYVDTCQKAQDTMYKQIAKTLNAGGIIGDDKLKEFK